MYSTTGMQVYTRERIALEYLEDYSHLKCELSEITRT